MHSLLRVRAGTARMALAMTIGCAQGLQSTACAVGPIPVSDSPRDPSNPKAPEGVTPAVAASAAPPQSAGAPAGHEHHAKGDADAGLVYACPMHPEVTSTTPGSCPKCNMKLVPRKSAR